MDKKKKITDINKLASFIVSEATKEEPEEKKNTTEGKPEKNPAAVALGRLGGLKGGNVLRSYLQKSVKKSLKKRLKQDGERKLKTLIESIFLNPIFFVLLF